MAYEIPGFSFTLDSGADLTGSQYCFVAISNTGKAVLPAIGQTIVGVLQNAPNTGEAATIFHSGISIVRAGVAVANANIPIGAANTTGKANLGGAASTDAVGVSLDAAAGDNSLFTCLLTITALHVAAA